MESAIVNIHEEHSHIDILADVIDQEMASLITLSDENNSIYRIPRRLRELNEKAYTPQVVSIGPLHHNDIKLRSMEEHKRRYLQEFLRRTEGDVANYLLIIKGYEDRLRNSYAEEIKLASDEFLKMVLIDAAFIIEIMLKSKFSDLRRGNDRIFTKPWMIADIMFDMCLLENQLPFFILKELFQGANIAMSSNSDGISPILRLVHEFATDAWDFSEIEEDTLKKKNFDKVEHLIDFLSICLVPLESDWPERRKLKELTTPTITDLHQAGVKFRPVSKGRLFDIKFHPASGVLEIPHLTIVKETELLFRNLLAFEQCHGSSNFINDFVVLINHLVNTPKDVDLLIQYGIIDNWLPDSAGVSSLFHGLVKEVSINPHNFYYAGHVEDMNKYCRTPWHKWKATLKQDYFRNPWAGISVFAAIVLLVLTFIQAIYAVLKE